MIHEIASISPDDYLSDLSFMKEEHVAIEMMLYRKSSHAWWQHILNRRNIQGYSLRATSWCIAQEEVIIKT